MTFFTVIFRNLFRRPVRTGLTLVGISIGIAALLALVGMSWGFEESWEKGFKALGTDVVIGNLRGGLMPKPFNDSVMGAIAHLPNVAEATSLLAELMSVEDAPMLMVSGREWKGFSWKNLKLVDGRLPRDSTEPAVVLGLLAADTLKKKIGDTVQIEATELRVVGIVDGGAVAENGSIILALPLLQKITANEGKINFINIRVTPGTTQEEINRLCTEVKAIFPEGRAMVARDVIGNSQGYRLIRAMSWGTSILAVLVGVLGVMNTMLMTVFERTHEIGILLALGWKPKRIIAMVLSEAALLGLLGGVAGVLIGVAGLRILETTPTVRGLLEPDLSAGLLLICVCVAVVVGVVSGLYPAWRGSRLSPSIALQS